jgi:hypothetical protein
VTIVGEVEAVQFSMCFCFFWRSFVRFFFFGFVCARARSDILVPIVILPPPKPTYLFGLFATHLSPHAHTHHANMLSSVRAAARRAILSSSRSSVIVRPTLTNKTNARVSLRSYGTITATDQYVIKHYELSVFYNFLLISFFDTTHACSCSRVQIIALKIF